MADHRAIATTVLSNLQHQHDWTSLSIHTAAPRPLVRGLPPRRLYVHPDDQIAALAREDATGTRTRPLDSAPREEWVLPVRLAEKVTLAGLSGVFDAVGGNANGDGDGREKRLILATLHEDSTVVYYLVHEGVVKPRQN